MHMQSLLKMGAPTRVHEPRADDLKLYVTDLSVESIVSFKTKFWGYLLRENAAAAEAIKVGAQCGPTAADDFVIYCVAQRGLTDGDRWGSRQINKVLKEGAEGVEYFTTAAETRPGLLVSGAVAW